MAGHYLSTTNPEAAAAIGQERSGDLPDIGDLVVYYPRPGEMPGGINRFPMLVMHVNHDGMVYGIAIAGINDERDVRAFRRSVENPAPAWDWPRQPPSRQSHEDAAGRPAPGTILSDRDLVRAVDRMGDELDEYRKKLDELIKQSNELERRLDQRPPANPEMVAIIDRRLDRLEQELGLDHQPKPQRVATPPARVAHKPAAKSKRKSKR
jgi:hypothetical protein